MSLREPYTMRSPDLRSALRIAPTILTRLYQRLNVEFADGSKGPARGGGPARSVYGTEVRRILEARGFQFPHEAKTCSMMMCKGGVGKTTSSFFLAQRLTAYGARVLLIDTDPQGNLTSAFELERYGYVVDEKTAIMVDVIAGMCSITDAIIEVTPSLHLVPSTPLNCILEGRIREHYKNPSIAFSKAIKDLKREYDYILFDCAPSLNLTNTAAVSASDLVVLPVAPDRFSQIGLDQTLSEIEQIERDFRLEVDKKIILTKFDGREYTSLKYLADVVREHDHRRFNVVIRTCADVKNVITKSQDLFQLIKSSARHDYDLFTREFMGLDATKLPKRLPGRRKVAQRGEKETYAYG